LGAADHVIFKFVQERIVQGRTPSVSCGLENKNWWAAVAGAVCRWPSTVAVIQWCFVVGSDKRTGRDICIRPAGNGRRQRLRLMQTSFA
jgi:hypothetical protein